MSLDERTVHGLRIVIDRLERVRFWCGFHIVRTEDDALIAECRQMLAIIELPTGKLLRLPGQWDKYREAARTGQPDPPIAEHA